MGRFVDEYQQSDEASEEVLLEATHLVMLLVIQSTGYLSIHSIGVCIDLAFSIVITATGLYPTGLEIFFRRRSTLDGLRFYLQPLTSRGISLMPMGIATGLL